MNWIRVAAATAVLLCAGVLWYWTTPRPPGFREVIEAHRRSDSVITDRYGQILQEIRTDPAGRRLEWVSLEAVSPRLVELLVFSEDRDFFIHHGVDWGALASAAWDTLFKHRRRGASTLTMQLAAQLDGSLRASGVHRSLAQKWRQLRAALALEQAWEKPQILEAYLNLVSFRGELQGIAAATRGLFGKQPHGLNSVETVILVALLRSPNADADAVYSRASRLARASGLQLDDARLAERTRRLLERPYQVSPHATMAPHLSRRVVANALEVEGPTPIRTTLDADLQRAAIIGLQEQLRLLAGRNVHDGAVLVVDNPSGDILAYVGNGGQLSSAVYVDGVQARRQAGSTLKPFLYGLALERRLITPASPINDAPLNLAVSGGVYRPSNYDNVFRGLVSARVALASSLNIPAVRLLQLVGEEGFVARLRDLGFEQLRNAEYYGPALALGTADVTLFELVNAYRTLANGGDWTRLRARDNSPETQAAPRRRVFSEATAFLVSDILSDRESRSSTFGLENALSTAYWSAVKTGTSKDMRDNWCVGYSPRITVGVWIGNFSGEPMWNVSGISGAAPLWREIMDRVHEHQETPSPAPPPDVLAQRPITAEYETGSPTEWFRKGTEEDHPRAVEPAATARILYPPHEAVLAIDPDIPPGRQRVFFEASAGNGLRWRLDGEDLGEARLMSWEPVAGHHRLELLDDRNRHRDGVSFSVRGGSSPRD